MGDSCPEDRVPQSEEEVNEPSNRCNSVTNVEQC